MLLGIGRFLIKLFDEINSYRVMFNVLDSFVSCIGNQTIVQPSIFMYIIIDYTNCHNASFLLQGQNYTESRIHRMLIKKSFSWKMVFYRLELLKDSQTMVIVIGEDFPIQVIGVHRRRLSDSSHRSTHIAFFFILLI